ncbi:hypothetical protein O5D80_007487 [Batrachochytrium dendrobatidis]|nr:hypothetical protein O5D80_007487 [Batrachochytrium dendrobatidis]
MAALPAVVVDRSMVLQLYKNLLARSSCLKHSNISYVRSIIRKDFESNRHVTDQHKRLALYKDFILNKTH